MTAVALNRLGASLYRSANFEQAADAFERALSHQEAALGTKNVSSIDSITYNAGSSLVKAARVQWDNGDSLRAQQLATRGSYHMAAATRPKSLCVLGEALAMMCVVVKKHTGHSPQNRANEQNIRSCLAVFHTATNLATAEPDGLVVARALARVVVLFLAVNLRLPAFELCQEGAFAYRRAGELEAAERHDAIAYKLALEESVVVLFRGTEVAAFGLHFTGAGSSPPPERLEMWTVYLQGPRRERFGVHHVSPAEIVELKHVELFKHEGSGMFMIPALAGTRTLTDQAQIEVIVDYRHSSTQLGGCWRAQLYSSGQGALVANNVHRVLDIDTSFVEQLRRITDHHSRHLAVPAGAGRSEVGAVVPVAEVVAETVRVVDHYN